eukprot:6651501-Alexandrium_andersonii.AAC.1
MVSCTPWPWGRSKQCSSEGRPSRPKMSVEARIEDSRGGRCIGLLEGADAGPPSSLRNGSSPSLRHGGGPRC